MCVFFNVLVSTGLGMHSSVWNCVSRPSLLGNVEIGLPPESVFKSFCYLLSSFVALFVILTIMNARGWAPIWALSLRFVFSDISFVTAKLRPQGKEEEEQQQQILFLWLDWCRVLLICWLPLGSSCRIFVGTRENHCSSERLACLQLIVNNRDKKSDIRNGTTTDDADDADDDDETMLELDRWYLIGNGTVAPAEVDMVPHTLNPVLHILLAPTTRNSSVMSSCRYRWFVVLGSRRGIAGLPMDSFGGSLQTFFSSPLAEKRRN